MHEGLFDDSAYDRSRDLFVIEGLEECIREWSVDRDQ